MKNKMDKSIKILGLIAVIMISSLLIFAAKKSDSEADNYLKEGDPNTSETYQIKALKIPENLDFAGERVPTKNDDIKERMDRELLTNTYWQSNTMLLLKRANKFFPMIEPILKENGIPNDFKYLAIIESGLLNVTSPAGAKGFWQILDATAKENGLEVNSNVDERYHVEKSTQAACNYLKAAKARFGNWTLAAAAYNAGNRGVSSKMETQKMSSYYDLLLGDETERYILRIVALKEIMSNPVKYGFIFDQEDLYTATPTKIVEVSTPIADIAQYAIDLGINYKIMKLHNPWLRENTLENKTGKTYQLKIPVETK
jgi:hypothetical protein